MYPYPWLLLLTSSARPPCTGYLLEPAALFARWRLVVLVVVLITVVVFLGLGLEPATAVAVVLMSGLAAGEVAARLLGPPASSSITCA